MAMVRWARPGFREISSVPARTMPISHLRPIGSRTAWSDARQSGDVIRLGRETIIYEVRTPWLYSTLLLVAWTMLISTVWGWKEIIDKPYVEIDQV
eukprot:g66707.t1